jgi:predicted MFS family arabinose efflux permease
MSSRQISHVEPSVQAPFPAVLPWSLYTLRQRWSFLAILFLVSTSNYTDRMVISVLLEPLKEEFRLSDTMLGLLSGFSFALFYVLAGIPIARWADRGNRRTVIALALTVWSFMTVLCGLAQTFWQLLLARVGVGAGESGGIPPAQSLIVDYFPPERRATALAIFAAGATTGYILGTGGGGFIADAYGWRSAFLLMGVPGLILAIIVWFILPEPRLQLGTGAAGAATESVRETYQALWHKRSFVFALVGSLLYTFVAYGALAFVPSFLVRVLRVPLAEAGLTYAIVSAVGTVIGTLGGGALADWMGRRDPRWLAWLPAIACASTGPMYLLAFAAHDLWTFMVVAFVAHLVLMAGAPTIFAAIHTVCGSRRRATAIAIVHFSATLFGAGVGPLATGALSDALTVAHGADGLRYSLMIATPVLVIAGAFYYAFGRMMPADQEA